MGKKKWRHILLSRREELQSIMQASVEDSRPVELDQSRVGRLSRMDALQGQAMAQETERRRQNEISRIDAALVRVESGDYGYCTSCDEEISEKRLELDPSTPLCIDCATVK
ncbi:TraR/DksA C4-type zinc finger protein [Sneathiella marina]|uniref:TraR/DksA C4-type zinc finger protein n=1 Tax=Sneathiella marina TaxID=2950108 RepID=A0ABY4W4E8_9PROT|nr:TraR/DksA C4-type zinc finger protein [Sneathiella marina]USG62076.1 TraR/DksA C4-type zinc finger protein [Sneathiella marina]